MGGWVGCVRGARWLVSTVYSCEDFKEPPPALHAFDYPRTAACIARTRGCDFLLKTNWKIALKDEGKNRQHMRCVAAALFVLVAVVSGARTATSETATDAEWMADAVQPGAWPAKP